MENFRQPSKELGMILGIKIWKDWIMPNNLHPSIVEADSFKDEKVDYIYDELIRLNNINIVGNKKYIIRGMTSGYTFEDICNGNNLKSPIMYFIYPQTIGYVPSPKTFEIIKKKLPFFKYYYYKIKLYLFPPQFSGCLCKYCIY